MKEGEFMRKKGSIEILCELEDGGKSFNEFKLDISPNTLSSRLKEALDLGLIEQRICREGRTKVKYYLTDRGKELLKAIKSIKDNYFRLKEDVKRLEEEINKKKEEIKRKKEELEKLVSSLKRCDINVDKD